MSKVTLTIILMLIIVTGFLMALALKNSVTGFAVQENQRVFTKALCNETNFCQDYYVVCQGSELIHKSPVTGSVIQHAENWTDPRNESLEKLCG